MFKQRLAYRKPGVFFKSGANFTPLNLPGLVAWYQADDGVYSDAGTTPAVNNGTVQQWNDASGNGRHLSQLTGANQPTYKTNSQNGLPGILFGPALGGMTPLSAATLNNPYIIFLVENTPSTNPNCRTIQGTVVQNILAPGRTTGNSAYVNTKQISSYQAPAGIHLCYLKIDTASYYEVDGVNRTNISTTVLDNWGALCLGKDGAVSEPVDATVYEIICCSGTQLSAGQISQTKTYLRSKWNTP